MRASPASFLVAASLTLASAGGCAYFPQTVYVPVGAVHGAEAMFPATPYTIAGAPDKGTVQVMALETKRLPVGPGAPELYLHLRLAAENASDDVPWLFNPNDQLVGYGGGFVSASFSQTSAARPVLVVQKGGRGWIDLYYPLPPEVDPLSVTLWWRVRHGATILAQTTTFQRLAGRDSIEVVNYASDDAALPSGLALGWWWPDYCFHTGGGGYRRSYGHPSESRSNDDRPTPFSTESSEPTNWRNPTSPPPPSESGGSPPSPGDSAKSAWRR
jgi:hypothetical protein